MKKKYLLSGEPGCGKTTIIKGALAGVEHTAGGFYTEEIRESGVRRGFEIVTLDGKHATMAHVDIRSPYRVSKYGVDVDSVDRLAVPSLREAISGCDIVVIDEIGKMELFSDSFKDAVTEALDSDRKVLGTIMLAPHLWADSVKQRADVEVIRVTRENRGEIAGMLMEWLAL